MKLPTPSRSKSESGWKQDLWAMWFAELVAIIGFAVVSPLLPLYVRDLGVKGERQVALWSGAVFSAQAVTMAIFGPIWGALSDRYGRKIMVERAMFGGSVIMALMGLAQSPTQLVILRAVQGALTGTVTAATALVATSAPKERAGYALGTLRTAIYLGATVGPLLGGTIADTLGYRYAFFVTSVLLLASAGGVLFFVQEPQRDTAPAGGENTTEGTVTARGRLRRHLSPVLDSAPIVAVLGVSLVMQSAARFVGPTLPLFIETIAPAGARVATISGVVTGARALGGAAGGRVLGELGDRLGYRLVLVVCALVSVVCYAPQSLIGQWMWILPLQLGAGLAMGGILASTGAALAALAPDGREGVVYGIDTTVVSAAKAIAPATGSLIAASWGLRSPFLATAAAYAAGALVALRLLPDLQGEIQARSAARRRKAEVSDGAGSGASSGLKRTCHRPSRQKSRS